MELIEARQVHFRHVIIPLILIKYIEFLEKEFRDSTFAGITITRRLTDMVILERKRLRG